VLSGDDAARLQLGGRDYVCLAFIDTGSGMGREVRERAFEPFFSTKGVGKGTGLGLSMAYGFVKQSGGHIEIGSEPGRGTTVTILLPRSTEAAVEKTAVPAATVAGGAETILVVDDEIAIQDNVAEILSALGYRVLRAGSADEAGAVLRQHHRVDLLFTDVIMPGTMNSPQLAELARQLHPGIRVLFTSGYSENAVIQDGRLKQGVALLNKPYSDEELARAIRAALNGSEQVFAQ
jgi:CheY-like chemotaxis protein